ncbi:MAG: rane protein [Desulfomicrobiaceae bacterium]|jgi:membrane protein|nr:hypothetical protein [Desulfomicrobiaceae bacterium]MDI3492668.1 rane protein [Desulfomicrobiaceae bacterium]MDK2873305.1 rane protein [Desulfomicrobiaceae bacterium]
MSAPTLLARAFLQRFAERFAATNCGRVAGGLAFTTLLAMVPLATMMLLFLRNVPAFAPLGEALREFLTAHLLPETAATLITRYTEDFTTNAGRLTAFGLGMLMVTAVMLLATIEDVFNAVWNARRSRGWIQRITLYWFMLTAGPLMTGGGIAAARGLARKASAFAGNAAWSEHLLAVFVPFALLWFFFSFLYFAVPNHPVRARIATGAGLVVAIAFALIQRGFTTFITSMTSYTIIYGAIAAVPIFLLWLYTLWLLILSGAIAAAAFQEASAEVPSLPPFAGRQAMAAVAMLETLWAAHHHGRGVANLGNAAHLPPHHAEPILERMRSLGWIDRTQDNLWVPGIAPHAITPGHVFAVFAVDAAAWKAHAPTAATAAMGEVIDRGLAPLHRPFPQWMSPSASLKEGEPST